MKTYALLSLTALTLTLASSAQAQTAQATALAPAPSLRAWTPVQPGAGYNVNTYSYDDGTSENAQKVWSGPGTWGVACWIHSYPATGGADTITKIDVAFGSALFPNNRPQLGAACNVGVWSDPNQDGNPNDGVLISQQASTVTVLGDTFQTITLGSPAPVSGIFFIGAWMANAPTTPQGGTNGEYPAAIDQTLGSNGFSWICGVGGTTTLPNTFDPNQLNLGGGPGGLVPTPNTLGVYLLRGEGSGSTPTVYCVAKVNSLGCTPTISFTGAPIAANTSGFTVKGSNVRNFKSGLLFYGTNTGQAAIPFTGGTLCVKTPIKRTQALNSGGNPLPANDCSGVYSIDMNAFAYQAGPPVPPPILQVSGTQMNVQFWGRDQGFAPPNNTTLTDALQYIIG